MLLKPTTFELEIQRTDLMRHEGTALVRDSLVNELFYSIFYCVLK